MMARRDNIYYRNAIGPKIRELRKSRKWTQDMLAARLQLLGWDISRATLAKIESGVIWIAEWQVLFFLKIFQVQYQELFPPITSDRLFDEVQQWLRQGSRYFSGNCRLPARSQVAHEVKRGPGSERSK